ncbi:MAG: aminoacyl-histidine dipeptidase [Thermoanaerobaculia bacterium]|nr:aminoacyl-histidine dipeptidase [Thermoanaerobaculia bacterium]
MKPSSKKYDELEPRHVWTHFASMSEVPRESKKEERIIAWAHEIAKRLGFESLEDETGNVIVVVPATEGSEDAPTIVLQAHLDMVCEKNAGTDHDFDVDPIRLVVEDGDDGPMVRAEGTTLGADNGIGVCLALAAAQDPDVRHPAMELLFTVDEETGMTGAIGLDASKITGRTLLNLDTEEDGILTVGCAGGCDSELTWTFDAEPVAGPGPTWRIEVRGLRGGHSGGDIHESRGAATKILARTLAAASAQSELRLVHLEAGSKRNAIPREGHAIVVGHGDALRDAAAKLQGLGRVESQEPELEVQVSEASIEEATALTAGDTSRLLDALLALPHGVLTMHREIEGLTESSNNLGILATETTASKKIVQAVCLSRSSIESRLDETISRIAAVARLSGARHETDSRYPGWAPDLDSPVLEVCRRVHEDLFGRTALVEATHGGLECGLLGARIPGLDMVSLGPRIEGAHSPDERTWESSVVYSWKYLVGILDELAGS